MTHKRFFSPTLEVAKGNRIHTRAAEAVVKAVEGRYNPTAVEILSTFPEYVQAQNKKKVMMQVKIRGRKYRYMSTFSTSTATTM